MSELGKNLKSVKAEAMGMLETIERVRGRQYAASAHCLLLIHQIAKLNGMMGRALDEHEPQLASAVRTAMPEMLTQLGLAVAKITEFGDERWKEIIADVESIDDSVDRLANSAIRAANSGKKFGGADVA